MKLQTSIKPRRDGTVRVLGKDSQTYVFAPGHDKELTCDVSDADTIAFLLGGGLFWPADPDDFQTALSLTKKEDEPEEMGAPKRGRKVK
jgi:hypothetical protein